MTIAALNEMCMSRGGALTARQVRFVSVVRIVESIVYAVVACLALYCISTGSQILKPKTAFALVAFVVASLLIASITRRNRVVLTAGGRNPAHVEMDLAYTQRARDTYAADKAEYQAQVTALQKDLTKTREKVGGFEQIGRDLTAQLQQKTQQADQLALEIRTLQERHRNEMAAAIREQRRIADEGNQRVDSVLGIVEESRQEGQSDLPPAYLEVAHLAAQEQQFLQPQPQPQPQADAQPSGPPPLRDISVVQFPPPQPQPVAAPAPNEPPLVLVGRAEEEQALEKAKQELLSLVRKEGELGLGEYQEANRLLFEYLKMQIPNLPGPRIREPNDGIIKMTRDNFALCLLSRSRNVLSHTVGLYFEKAFNKGVTKAILSLQAELGIDSEISLYFRPDQADEKPPGFRYIKVLGWSLQLAAIKAKEEGDEKERVKQKLLQLVRKEGDVRFEDYQEADRLLVQYLQMHFPTFPTLHFQKPSHGMILKREDSLALYWLTNGRAMPLPVKTMLDRSGIETGVADKVNELQSELGVDSEILDRHDPIWVDENFDRLRNLRTARVLGWVVELAEV